jgi:Plasmid encoded RepA protein
MSEDGQPPLPGFKRLGSVLPALAVRSLPTRQRIVDASVAIRGDQTRSIIYQHTVLCQTCLPYRNPGDEVRVWDRENGKVSLRVRAGEARHPQCGWIQIGLPYGPKPRLMLGYLNTRAILQQSPAIEVEDSLTAFVRRLGLNTHGRNLRTIKDQLARLARACEIAAFDLPVALAASPRVYAIVRNALVSKRHGYITFELIRKAPAGCLSGGDWGAAGYRRPANPSSRIGAVFGWLPAVYQRVSLKGLHYGRGRLGWAAAVILGGGWGGNCNLSWLIRSCSSGSGWV